ncbi:MAG: ABC transporter ATP-binding protein [Deltaproteobacteria bacterium]|nr:ABC transporter ATP-binding protein [Deltaproteobacteria bacterium]
MALLELKGLTKYFGGLAAVSDLDFSVEAGEIVGLIGPNGAGKTTVFNLISGVFAPTDGEIHFRGEDITGLKPDQVAKKGLARTFQSTILFELFPTVMNVVVGAHLHAGMNFFGTLFNTRRTRHKEQETLARVMDIINFLELGDWAMVPAQDLPHGHQRALGVGIALATEPKLLLLDEPVTGMNPEETIHMMGLIKKIRDERDLTIVLVEHDMRAVMGLCDRLSVLSFGKKLAEGTPEEIQNNKEVIEAYLGVDEDV